MKLLLTCEHGGHHIPEIYQENFQNESVLKSHRGYDLGALDVFQYLEPLATASYFSTTSRLLIELNRSLHHHQLFSEYTKPLSPNVKTKIINDYYLPYRNAVENRIKAAIDNDDFIIHFSIHSFTPQLNGENRNCDIGLLYDSSKKQEQLFCKYFKTELLKHDSNLKIRFNYPYLGKADGFTTYLRQQFPSHYLGIELEVNQKLVTENGLNLHVKKILYQTVKHSITSNRL